MNQPENSHDFQLDRDADTRLDVDKLDQAWHAPSTRVLRVHGDQIPVTPTGRLILSQVTGRRSDSHWYIGKIGSTAIFAEPVDHIPDGETWKTFLEIAEHIPPAEQQIIIATLALARWHEAAQFSPRDGTPTNIRQAGWMRTDTHGIEHFPRTDPAVIVRIEHDNKILLGSNALWPAGRFSLLAGFIEAGESAESAVVREVFEESGMRLGKLDYIRSQAWPFPRSLMLGFRAELVPHQDPNDLIPQTEEITELRWFTRDEITSPPPGITLPGANSLAAGLIADWIDSGHQ